MRPSTSGSRGSVPFDWLTVHRPRPSDQALSRVPSVSDTIDTTRGAVYPRTETLLEVSLCDYSLAHFPNRLAVEGEQLVVHRFDTLALGLAPACPTLKQKLFPTTLPAVCVPPGARLLLRDIPEHLQQRVGVTAVEEVTFVEQTLEAFRFRDAVRFANGKEILLQHLQRGQRVDVLRVCGSAEEIEPQVEEQDYRHTLPGDRVIFLAPRD